MIVRALKKQEAFRYLQSGRKTEKTAIEFLDQDVVPNVPRIDALWHFDPLQVAYIITGAFSGLGRSIARWVMRRNARQRCMTTTTKMEIDTS